MKTTAVLAMSADGRTTNKDGEIYTWTSKEDSEQFFDLVSKSSLIVMGSSTYVNAKPYIKLKPKTLRVVLTSRPGDFVGDSVAGQLEFSSESPSELIERLAGAGYSQMLLVGGPKILGSFVSLGLVDELRLTIEPRVLGQGSPLMVWPEGVLTPGGNSHTSFLRLKSIQKLNENGTLLLNYQFLAK